MPASMTVVFVPGLVSAIGTRVTIVGVCLVIILLDHVSALTSVSRELSLPIGKNATTDRLLINRDNQ